MKLDYPKKWFERSAQIEGDAEVGAGVLPDFAALRLPSREIDCDKLEERWRKGKEAWAGIGSPTEWVEQLRQS